ncbi:MAG: pyridoxamine 5'-phosphate oxidase family protein [Pseudomonadota bacterium]
MKVSDIAFTDAVKAQQARLGSRESYRKSIDRQDWSNEVTPDLAAFLAERDSFYLATVNSDGQPYIQHRGGQKGFLKPVGPQSVAFADFAGNRQYISMGNLSECDKVSLFFMDYANRRRIKMWGRARVIEDDPDLLAQLTDPGYRGKPERAFVIDIEAWDVNCPQHIPELYSEDVVRQVAAKLSARVAELEAENAELKAWVGRPKAE